MFAAPVQHARDNDVRGDQGRDVDPRSGVDPSPPTSGHRQTEPADPHQEPEDERD